MATGRHGVMQIEVKNGALLIEHLPPAGPSTELCSDVNSQSHPSVAAFHAAVSSPNTESAISPRV